MGHHKAAQQACNCSTPKTNPTTETAVRDSAWRSYMIYAEQMLKQGNAREARRVLDQGFKHFEEAPNAWVEYIGMQVKLKETKKAETLAQECGQRFKGYQPACSRAADPNRHAPKGPASFAWLEDLFSR